MFAVSSKFNFGIFFTNKYLHSANRYFFILEIGGGLLENKGQI